MGKTGIAVVFVLLTSTFAGCEHPVDLQKIQAYANAVASAAPSFDVVADDYARTCVQIREHTDQSHAWLQNAPKAEFTPPPSPAPAATTSGFGQSYPNCADAALVAQQWQKRNKVVVDYVYALAAIAGVNTKPSGLSDLTGQLTNVGLVGTAPATLFTDLGNAIIQSLLESEQQAALRKALQQGNGPFQDSTAALRKLSASYQILLASDLVQTDGFYQVDVRKRLAERAALENAPKKPGNASLMAMELTLHVAPVDIYNERQQWLAERINIQTRMSQATAYDSTMSDLASTNKDLTEASEKGASFGDMIDVVNQHVVPIVNDASALTNPGK